MFKRNRVEKTIFGIVFARNDTLMEVDVVYCSQNDVSALVKAVALV